MWFPRLVVKMLELSLALYVGFFMLLVLVDLAT